MSSREDLKKALSTININKAKPQNIGHATVDHHTTLFSMHAPDQTDMPGTPRNFDSDNVTSSTGNSRLDTVPSGFTALVTDTETIVTRSEYLRANQFNQAQHALEFAPLRKIPDELLKAQLLTHVDLSSRFTTKHCQMLRRTEGGSHHVAIIRVGTDEQYNDFVIRIPVTGTKERWCEEYARLLRDEAQLMCYLRRHTRIPIPKIIAYQDTIQLPLGAPYILMRKASGKSANTIWFDPEDEDGQNADNPSKQTLERRRTFLASLARHMSELQKLNFKKLGMLSFEDDSDNPVVSHYWEMRDSALVRQEAVASSRESLLAELDKKWPASTLQDLLDAKHHDENVQDTMKGFYRQRGLRRVMEIIYACPCFDDASTTVGREPYVLRHPDMDLQNILVDDDGNVTSIIDWTGTITTPRCIGYAALPRWLTHDWFPQFTLSDPPYMSWTIDSYRRMYADAMKNHCDDGKYTYKSAMYQAVIAAPACTWCSNACFDVVKKVLLQLPGLRLTNLDEFLERLGRRWAAAEEYLKVEIESLFEAEEHQMLQ